jgi:hypothetical protein
MSNLFILIYSSEGGVTFMKYFKWEGGQGIIFFGTSVLREQYSAQTANIFCTKFRSYTSQARDNFNTTNYSTLHTAVE